MKAVIYVFSGTGNTLKACELYRKTFEKHDVYTEIYKLKKGFSGLPLPDGFDLIGFAYPVHGFNAPEIMLELVDYLPDADGKKCFILNTSGEPLRLNNASSLKLCKKLEKAGYDVAWEYHYTMPYNMIFRHSDEMAARMYDTLSRLAPIEAEEILRGERHSLKRIPFGGVIAAAFRIEQPAMNFNGKRFSVDAEKCVSCGKCVKNCPTQNITVKDGKLSFNNLCIGCTRCSFNCPTDAIEIGFLKGWRVSGAYDFSKAPRDTDLLKISADGKHERYCCRAYERYFKEVEEKIEGAEAYEKFVSDQDLRENAVYRLI